MQYWRSGTRTLVEWPKRGGQGETPDGGLDRAWQRETRERAARFSLF